MEKAYDAFKIDCKLTVILYETLEIVEFFVKVIFKYFKRYVGFLSEIGKFSNALMIGVSILAQFIIYPSFKTTDFKSFKSYHLNYTKKCSTCGSIMLVNYFLLSFWFINIYQNIFNIIIYLNINLDINLCFYCSYS